MKNQKLLTMLLMVCLCGGFTVSGESPKTIPKVILDCDMGMMNDDMLALSMLLKAEKAGKIELLGITLEGGNNFISADYENYGETQRNQKECAAAFLTRMSREDIPVFTGTDYPMGYNADNIGELSAFYESLRYLQDSDTYGAVHFFQALSNGALTDSDDARDFLISSANRYPGEIVIFAIGPTMNLARAVLRDASFAGNIAAVYYMGGAFGAPYDALDSRSIPVKAIGGANITPYAEYNVCYDALSFEICITAGFPVQIISPGEISEGIDFETVNRLKSANICHDPVAEFWLESYQTYIQEYPYWDPIAVAAFLRPENMQSKERYVRVYTDRTDECYAMTVALNKDEYSLIPTTEKRHFGKAFVISDYTGFWDYAIELLCK